VGRWGVRQGPRGYIWGLFHPLNVRRTLLLAFSLKVTNGNVGRAKNVFACGELSSVLGQIPLKIGPGPMQRCRQCVIITVDVTAWYVRDHELHEDMITNKRVCFR